LTRGRVWLLIALVVLSTRLCHLEILWTEENLPLATAQQVVDGNALYKDVWFDKPPLVVYTYLLWGAQGGFDNLLNRLAGVAFVLLCCWLLSRFASEKWGEEEGLWAASLLAFYLTFGIHSAILPLAADLLMLAPHIAAIWFAWKGRSFWSGFFVGICFLINAKAAFVGLACFAWFLKKPVSWPLLGAGFVLPNAVVAMWLVATGSWDAYLLQVWTWGGLYAQNTFVDNPWSEGLRRILNWSGFHAPIVLASVFSLVRERDDDRLPFLFWLAVSILALILGARFFPRYFFQILPALCLLAAHGFVLLGKRKWILVALLLVPLLRFGPRHVELGYQAMLAHPHDWRDVAMDQESREVGQRLAQLAGPEDSLLVWGYRPDVFIYSRLSPATIFLETQPLTGVYADRHLFDSGNIAPEITRINRQKVAESTPDWLVDGLSGYNPDLSIAKYPELQDWVAQYEEVEAIGRTTILRRKVNAE
jgi:hypothetical protein